jgi:hypothetical protein
VLLKDKQYAAYLEALLLLKLYTHEDDHAGTLRGGVDVILLVVVDYHVVEIDALSEGLDANMVRYPAIEQREESILDDVWRYST